MRRDLARLINLLRCWYNIAEVMIFLYFGDLTQDHKWFRRAHRARDRAHAYLGRSK